MNRFREYNEITKDISGMMKAFPDSVRDGRGEESEREIARLYVEAGMSAKAGGALDMARVLFGKATVLAPNARAPWYELAQLASIAQEWPLLVCTVRECLRRETDKSIEFRSDDPIMSDPGLWGHRPHLLYFIGLSQCGCDTMADAVMKTLLDRWGDEPEVKRANQVRLDLIEESKFPEGVLK